MTVSTLQITAVKPNNYNPNHMGPDKFAELVEEIRHLGRLPKAITRTGNCRFPRSTPTTRAS